MAEETEWTLEQVECEIDALRARVRALARIRAIEEEADGLTPRPGPNELADNVLEYSLPYFVENYCSSAEQLGEEFALADPVGVFALIENANARVAAIVEECVAAIRALPSGSGE